MGLCSVLDVAKPGDRIMLVSYGSGAGSDAFDITVTDEIKKFERDKAPTIKEMIEKKRYVNYAIYAKYRNLLYWE